MSNYHAELRPPWADTERDAPRVLRGVVERLDPESGRWLQVAVYWRDLGFRVRDRRRA